MALHRRWAFPLNLTFSPGRRNKARLSELAFPIESLKTCNDSRWSRIGPLVNNRFSPKENRGIRERVESAMSSKRRGSSDFRRASSGSSLRPTTSKVRSAIFSMLGPAGPSGFRVLDIYAGTGALGIEALQRGAESAVFVEQNSRQCNEIKKALERHGLAMQGTVQRGGALQAVGRLGGEFDLIFADPPYDLNEFEELFSRVDDAGLLAPNAIAFLEHSKTTRLPDTLPGLRLTAHRKYGDSAVSVYKVPNQDAPPGRGGK